MKKKRKQWFFFFFGYVFGERERERERLPRKMLQIPKIRFYQYLRRGGGGEGVWELNS